MNRIINYFKGISLELKKVSWLTKEQLISSTLIVGFFSIIICIFLFILDFGLTQFVQVIFNIDIG